MFKNLVKRSEFQKIIVAVNAPITMLLEGDEVYAMILRDPQTETANGALVNVTRQTEQDLFALTLTPDDKLENSFQMFNGGRYAIGTRRVFNPITYAQSEDSGVDLLCGFSDNVTFSVPENQVDVVHLLIETIHYQPRR